MLIASESKASALNSSLACLCFRKLLVNSSIYVFSFKDSTFPTPPSHKASADSNSVTPETLPEYTEVIYKKLIELMDEED